ncbi:MAG TPA: RbsD/FucU domain-containing protein [Chitinophagaceae bacterium]|jgi:L-fucose mutarotase|nr:RbsD/FucU domain-containing protein [Fermentimonas sp.]HZH87738.1 RbsD/FucU domain-containing protein [Chitinophagaceae bacterium]
MLNEIPKILSPVLELFPLDTYVEFPVYLMEVAEGDPVTPDIWHEYNNILNRSGEPFKIGKLERFNFYERAKKAYAVIATGEGAQYANIILKKGVVR